jgi:hypothetical protein
MVIVRMNGGLGNQMFQYALGCHLADKNQTELKLDLSAFERDKKRRFDLHCFNIRGQVASRGECPAFKSRGMIGRALSKLFTNWGNRSNKSAGSTQFDTIYHEHFSYFSLSTVKNIFETHGLELFDVEELITHGGSLRIYAKHKKNKKWEKGSALGNLLKKERENGLLELDYYQGFQKRIDEVKNGLLTFLLQAKNEGKKVAAYGAAAKGNTFLNYAGIRKDLVSFVVDASTYKQGKYLPGTHIPVVSEKRIQEYKPDYVVLLPWNIKEEIIGQLEYARTWGCKFVVAIPDLRVL